MANHYELIETSMLKTTQLEEYALKKLGTPIFDYDKEVDSLVILFPHHDEDVVAHYVDDHVALLYTADSLQVVGLQIENFAVSFVPQHNKVARLWQLQETGTHTKDLGELILFVETRVPEVAREATEELQDLLGDPGQELLAAFP